MQQNLILGIIAPKGSGKTHLATKIQSQFSRVAIFDLVGEPAWADVCDDLVLGSPRDFAEAITPAAFRVVYRPGEYDTETGKCDEFNWFARLCFLRSDLLMVVDEAHLMCSPQVIPKPLRLVPLIGRHRLVSLVYITQSFTAVHRSLTRATNTFAVFRLTDDLDLAGLAARCGKDVADRARNLRKLDAAAGRPGEILRWSDVGQIAVVSAENFAVWDPTSASVELHDRRPGDLEVISDGGETDSGDSGRPGGQPADDSAADRGHPGQEHERDLH